jgi:CBS domain-containing protein
MTPDPVSVPAGYTIGRLIDEVAWQRRHTSYPVLDDGHVVGLLAFRCLSSIPRNTWDARSIRECMLPLDQVPQLRADAAAIDALVELSETSVNRGVVLDGGRLVGIISAADLGRALEVRPRTPRRIEKTTM